MIKFTQILPFVRYLFDEDETARIVARIVEGIFKSRSPRMSDISRAMPGGEAANYKCVQRLIDGVDPQEVLLRLFQSEAPFMIGEPIDISFPQACLDASLVTPSP
jgi:hypothetical protein